MTSTYCQNLDWIFECLNQFHRFSLSNSTQRRSSWLSRFKVGNFRASQKRKMLASASSKLAAACAARSSVAASVGACRLKHTLPDLPYDYNALEPTISAEIMQLHHSKHHNTYVTNLNVAEEKLEEAKAKSTRFFTVFSFPLTYS